MADEEEIVVDIADILPLQKSIYWVASLPPESQTAMGVKNEFAAAMFDTTAAGMEGILAQGTEPEATRSLLMSMDTNHWTGQVESQITLDIDTLRPNNSPSANWNADADNLLDGKTGNIGDADSTRRAEWFEHLQRANAALGKAYNDIPEEDWPLGGQYLRPRSDLPSSLSTFSAPGRPYDPALERNGKNTPDLFVLRPDSYSGPASAGVSWWYVPYSVVARLVSLHNNLYDSQLSVFSSARDRIRVDQDIMRALLDNVELGLVAVAFLMDVATQRPDLVDQEVEKLLADTALAEAEDTGEGINDFILAPLTARERQVILNQPDYQKYFTTTFNQQAIVSVPILQNFFLTTKYFSKIKDSFENTNDAIINILLSTIRNDDNYKREPVVGRTESRSNNEAGLPRAEDANIQARDFILKMLLVTPVNILKGLAEIVDPHVALSKIIKTGTGFAFNELAKGLDPVADGIKTLRTSTLDQDSEDYEEEVDEIMDGAPDGDDLLRLVLCLIDQSMQADIPVPAPPWGDADGDGIQNIADPDDPGPVEPPPPNFYPRISEKGIDFTGTIMGMFMIPPSPIGLIYLLLGLINSEETGTTEDVIDVTPETPDCDTPATEET